ncbi:hypothetical protein FTX61_15850 [Nitriliruptoraceae bacterium ZYF776]|nr:hypothetical protein [Profundirhabdus halotolerans]
MDDTNAPTGTALVDARTPQRRDCTRCDGTQHLVASFEGMGKYRCEACELTIGYDLDASPAEFLLDRGLPSRYTQDNFGPHLLGAERRLS